MDFLTDTNNDIFWPTISDIVDCQYQPRLRHYTTANILILIEFLQIPTFTDICCVSNKFIRKLVKKTKLKLNVN